LQRDRPTCCDKRKFVEPHMVRAIAPISNYKEEDQVKLRRFAILSSAFVCFSTAAPAFAATLVVDNDFADCPQADFNSIQAAVDAAEPGDKILVCRGTYLETVVVTKDDLRIEAQAAPGEVVLDGMLTKPFGFHLLNTTGVLVQGFTVQKFVDANIRIEGRGGNTLRKNVTALAGIVLSGIGSGIRVINSSANVVEQNSSFTNAAIGITVTGAASSENIIRHNETFNNALAGLQIMTSGRGNILFGNDSHNNPVGLRNVVSAPESVIENNRVVANVQGIIVGASTGVTVRNNRSERNTEFGIRLQNGAVKNLVEKNEVFQNDQDGIRLEPAVGQGSAPVVANIVQINHIQRNGRDGIRVFPGSAENTIERNVIRKSGALDPLGLDAHDDSVGAGTGGTANLWINNKCETENRLELCKNPDL
jgi:parallel beta-helix repeat protein